MNKKPGDITNFRVEIEGGLWGDNPKDANDRSVADRFTDRAFIEKVRERVSDRLEAEKRAVKPPKDPE